MRSSRVLTTAIVVLVSLFGVACPTVQGIPGEFLANFSFVVSPADGGFEPCTNAGYINLLPDSSYNLTVTFSGELDGSVEFMTFKGSSRDASFDGQYVTSANNVPRVFTRIVLTPLPDGGSEASEVSGVLGLTEQFTVALLSSSQTADAGGVCDPANIPSGSPPGMTSTGFDAVLACGQLTDTIEGDGGWPSCAMMFDVAGSRL